MIDPFCDSLLQFGNVVEDAAAYLLASDLGEEALNQIEPGRRCRDEVQLEARMALEPALYSRRLVRGVVVGDQVEVEIGEGFSVDLLQKLEEFPGAMARHAFADDLACRHIERRKQGCRAVTFIVVRHGAGAPLLEGQTWLRAIEGLDLAFLVDGKHQSFFGRIEIEADDILHFLSKVRVVGDLEGANDVGFKPILLPDALHAGVANADLVPHYAHAPVRGMGWALLDGLLDDRALESLGNRLLAGRLASSFDHAGDASFDKILLPAPNRRLGDTDRSHNCHYAGAGGRHQHNLGPFCHLLGSVPIPDYLLKLGAILRAECEFRLLRFHAARESHSQRFGIHMFVTEH